MLKQKTLSIILLLFVLSTGYLMRHSLPAEPVDYVACFMDDVQDQMGIAKAVHHIAYSTQSKVKFSFTLAEVIHIICVVAAIVVSKRKSHIEYCGKKMVRAIMLNFHPKIRNKKSGQMRLTAKRIETTKNSMHGYYRINEAVMQGEGEHNGCLFRRKTANLVLQIQVYGLDGREQVNQQARL